MEIINIKKRLNQDGSCINVDVEFKCKSYRKINANIMYAIKNGTLKVLKSSGYNSTIEFSSAGLRSLIKKLHANITYQSLVLQNGRNKFDNKQEVIKLDELIVLERYNSSLRNTIKT